MHQWLNSLLGWIPAWLRGTAILLCAGVLALLCQRLFIDLLYRLAGRVGSFFQLLVARSRGPGALLFLLIALGAALPAAGFDSSTQAIIGRLLLILTVLAIGWASINALNLAADRYAGRFRVEFANNLLARKHVTQIEILRRVAVTLIVMVTCAAALMTIPSVRQYGVSLFASAGVAGLILGLAARPVLSNLIAGIQIAMTQPIRIEDSVVVEGEWGWIESIGSAYVVIRLWDWRRLIVPLTYFIEKPFQNWTYESANLIGTVLIHVDYTVPVQRVRDKLQAIAAGSGLWDGKVVNLQVTDLPGAMVELRALVSARNASDVWDLRCLVREKLIEFLQADYPEALPRQRALLERRSPIGRSAARSGDGAVSQNR